MMQGFIDVGGRNLFVDAIMDVVNYKPGSC